MWLASNKRTATMNMNTNLLKTALCACGLVAAAATALSAPLQRADVPAEPAWVLHLDCDGLRPTAIGRFLLAEMEKPEAQAKLAAFQTIFNFDLRKQLHGLTLYSTGKAPEDGVLLVYADFEPERLVTLAKAAKDYQSTTYKQHTIHNWIDDKKKAKDGVKPRVYAAIQGGRIVVFAQQQARVAQALDVLDQAAPNLAGNTVFAQLGAGGSTGFIQAAARKLDLPDSTPNAAHVPAGEGGAPASWRSAGAVEGDAEPRGRRRGGGKADGLGRAGPVGADEAAAEQPRLGQACRGALAQAGWRGRGGRAGRLDRRGHRTDES